MKRGDFLSQYNVIQDLDRHIDIYRKLIKVLHDENVTFSECEQLIFWVNEHIKVVKEDAEYPDFYHWSNKIKVREVDDGCIADIDDIFDPARNVSVV